MSTTEVGGLRWAPAWHGRGRPADDTARSAQAGAPYDRAGAAAEERRRVARELHDGVAQRVAALGYLVDDVAAMVQDTEVAAVVEALRGQVTAVAQELRSSVSDLRTDHGSAVDEGVSEALSAYVGELGRGSDVVAHLYLDETGARRARGVEHEVLMIAREAISNVHQHARADHLWVSLTSDERRLRLVVEDDGAGQARPRRGHFGLQGMKERAARIGGVLELRGRATGGTVVILEVPPPDRTDRRREQP
ncbi:sensor histidine kinase [Nocardioides sp. 31GB23]|uniref:sensor histidine kinase n=1 Tax=Nocardioides sp. 31GB23 TaxID=3156065 RepID=UPI0032AF74B9